MVDHRSTTVSPIFADFYDGESSVRLWEIPPNGQGITALIALNILQYFVDELRESKHNSAEYLHVVIEAVRLAFADTLQHCADQDCVKVPVKELLSKDYAKSRAELIRGDLCIKEIQSGLACEQFGNDTAYFCATDFHGNACSFINSNFMGFGTGIVPEGCGFTLQNRGANFSLDRNHPNCIAPRKRPYHTIIPAMLTTPPRDEADKTDLLAVMGVMGGFMQPQGHLQILLNMVLFGMNPQEALTAPRFCIGPGHEGPVGSVSLEEGIADHVLEELRRLGHDVRGPVTGFDRTLFGRGHIIKKETRPCTEEQCKTVNDESRQESRAGAYLIGCEPRSDGKPCGY